MNDVDAQIVFWKRRPAIDQHQATLVLDDQAVHANFPEAAKGDESHLRLCAGDQAEPGPSSIGVRIGLAPLCKGRAPVLALPAWQFEPLLPKRPRHFWPKATCTS